MHAEQCMPDKESTSTGLLWHSRYIASTSASSGARLFQATSAMHGTGAAACCVACCVPPAAFLPEPAPLGQGLGGCLASHMPHSMLRAAVESLEVSRDITCMHAPIGVWSAAAEHLLTATQLSTPMTRNADSR